MDETPDIPLDNFGADTEVATPPVANDSTNVEDNQTTQPTDASGSEDTKQPENEKTADQSEDNPIAEEQKSGRPEKQDRLQSRFGELTGKIKERDTYIEQLEAQMARAQAMNGVKPLQPDEDGQYSVEAIQQQQAQMAQAAAQAEVQVLRSQIEREQVANRMDTEGTQIEKTLEEKGLTNEIHAENIRAEIEEKVALAQYNPQALKQISPLKIAERYIKGIEAERRNASSATASNLNNLQAEQAVTPESSPSSVDENSVEAIEARLADAKF